MGKLDEDDRDFFVDQGYSISSLHRHTLPEKGETGYESQQVALIRPMMIKDRHFCGQIFDALSLVTLVWIH